MFTLGGTMNTIVTSKQEILKQSRYILQTKGYRSISIRAIAQACHVSIESIYNYFDSKTDLISETIESVWLEIFHPSNMESSPKDVDAWIEWVMQRLEESQTLYPDFFRLHAIYFEKNEQKEGQKHMHKIWDHIEESLISVLMKDPKIRKDAFNASFTPKAFAHTLFSMLQNLALRGEYDPKIVLEIVHRVLYD